MVGEEGCFVYKVLSGSGIGVRRAPCTEEAYKTGRSFEKGDLVSIDLVVDKAQANGSGPFLRLSDGSGWLFVKKEAKDLAILERIEVQSGFWCFYVESSGGIALRNHPIDQLQQEFQRSDLFQLPSKVLPCMHKVFCDRKVKGRNGVNFYRVQDKGYAAWIFDKRVTTKNGDANTKYTLVPEGSVQEGLFAFKALHSLAIRSSADVAESSRTNWSIRRNDIVVCDLVRESPYKLGNGPFLRLVDGSGWLFVNKKWEKMMEEIPIDEGKWRLRVKTVSGVKLRKQPMDHAKCCSSDVLEQGETVMCDRRIQSRGPSGMISYYRKEGSNVWVFDRRGDHQLMELASLSPRKAFSSHVTEGWTLDHVRNIARTISELEEIDCDKQSRVVCFRNSAGLKIHVHYATRTVGTAKCHGRKQVFRRDCTVEELIEIFKNPKVHTGQGLIRAARHPSMDSFSICSSSASSSIGGEVDVEGEFRNQLVDLDAQISILLAKKNALWNAVKARETTRFQAEATRQQLQQESLVQEGASTSPKEDNGIGKPPRSPTKARKPMNVIDWENHSKT